MDNKKKKAKKLFVVTKMLCAIFLLACFAVMFVVGLFFPRVTSSRYDKELTEFPAFTMETFLSGEYTDKITKWYSDTIFGRDDFKDINALIQSLCGPEEEDEFHGSSLPPIEDPLDISDDTSSSDNSSVSPSLPPDVSSEYSDDESGSTVVSTDTSSGDTSSDTSSAEVSPPPQGDGEEELIDAIFIDKNNRAMELYAYTTAGGKRYADYMNAFYKDLKAAIPNVNMYSMFIPKASGLYLWDANNAQVKAYAGETEKAIKSIDSMLDPAIKSVNVYNTLLEHKNEQIYFRTDHHWTTLGAYYACVELAKSANVPYLQLNEYDKEVRKGFLGSLYKYTNYSPKLLNNKEDFEIYRPKGITYPQSYTAMYHNTTGRDEGFEHDVFWYVNDQNSSSWYMQFINGDMYAVNIKSNVCNNGRKLMLIKDSYGDAMAPHFMKSFEEVWIIDARYFESNAIEFAKEKGITDVCFSMVAYSCTGGVAKHIERLRTLPN